MSNAGTSTAYENPCPAGTYMNETGAKATEDCVPCPGGYYCDEEGQTTYWKLCTAGLVGLQSIKYSH